jgi:hypothetical protein
LATAVGVGSSYVRNPFLADVYNDEGSYCSHDAVTADPSALCSVQPTITGPSTLWWFNGANPANYSTSVTLIASTAITVSYSWTITTGTNQLRFDDNSTSKVTSSNQATVKTINFSTNPNEIGVTVTVNGQTSPTLHMTSLTPRSLDPLTPRHDPDTQRGYISQMIYRILDQFGTVLPFNVEINENFTSSTAVDYPGMNWPPSVPNGDITAPDHLVDFIAPPVVFSGMVPIPNLPQTPLGNVKVAHISQEIYVGSQTLAAGRRVQSDVSQQYQDHGAHLNIVSPSP